MKTFISAGILAMSVCLTVPGWVAADDANTGTTAPANDKMGTTTNPTYNTGTPDNSGAVKPGETKTVPSGKRHRTHKKHGNDGQTPDQMKGINAADNTPSK